MTLGQYSLDLTVTDVQPEWIPFEAGDILGDKYRVVALLGKGGMGAVYRVTQLLLNVDVALKTLNTQKEDNPNAIRRFQTEAKAAFSLKHPNLVNVHDFGLLDNSNPFIAMELIEGQTLQSYMQGATLSLSEIEAIFVRLCFALSYAHQNGIVHRDIKPGNIMLCKNVPLSDEGCVKILDFGLAKIMNSLDIDLESLTKTGDVIGSPLYMSPEQCSGAALDHRTDIYSLGCVLFEALTGTPPLVGQNSLRTMMLHQTQNAPTLKEAALGRDFPPGMELIVSKLLAKSPADRYTDLGLVAIDLKAVCSGREPPSFGPVVARAVEICSPRREVSISWLQLSLLIFTIVLLSSACGYGFSWHEHHNPAQPTTSSERVAIRDAQDIARRNFVSDEHDKLQKEALEEKELSRRAFLAAPPITQTNTKVMGRDAVAIEFPKRAIGTVEYSFQGEGSKKYKVEAVGTKNFPLNVPLIYHLSDRERPDVVSNPFIFDKIGRNVFSGLTFSGSLAGQSIRGIHMATDASSLPSDPVNESAVKSTAHVPQLEDEMIDTKHLIECACKWSKLRDLSLSNTVVTGELANLIGSVVTLKRLTLRACAVEPQELFTPVLCKRIERVDLTQMHADPVIELLSGSPSLEVVDLGDRCSVTAAALSKLASCPKLSTLMLQVSPMPDDAIAAILTIKSLKMLAVNKNGVSQSQLDLIEAEHWQQAAIGLSGTDDVHLVFFRGR